MPCSMVLHQVRMADIPSVASAHTAKPLYKGWLLMYPIAERASEWVNITFLYTCWLLVRNVHIFSMWVCVFLFAGARWLDDALTDDCHLQEIKLDNTNGPGETSLVRPSSDQRSQRAFAFLLQRPKGIEFEGNQLPCRDVRDYLSSHITVAFAALQGSLYLNTTWTAQRVKRKASIFSKNKSMFELYSERQGVLVQANSVEESNTWLEHLETVLG